MISQLHYVQGDTLARFSWQPRLRLRLRSTATFMARIWSANPQSSAFGLRLISINLTLLTGPVYIHLRELPIFDPNLIKENL